MAWFTTKKGKHINTDWFDAEDQLKFKQIQANNLVASQLSTITHNPNLNADLFGSNNYNSQSYNSIKSLAKPSKANEKTKQAVKKLKAFGHPVRPIGGKTIRAEDWKPIDNDVTPWGFENNHKTVAGNKWGDNQPQKTLQAKVYDRTHNVLEKDYHKVDKAEVMKDIEGWKNDDGTYGTGDEAIYVAYEDGKVVALHELNPGEKWSKQGISGLRISTGDYEMVWGGEWVRRPTEKPRFEPYETFEVDDMGNDIPGKQNSYSGYKVVGHYKERVLEQNRMKVQTNKGRDKYNFDKGQTRFKEDTTREVIQRSTIEWTDAKKKEVAAKLEADKVTDRTVVMLKKRGAVHPEEVESYVRNLSDIRRNDLAKKMNIGGRGEEKTQEIIRTLKDRFDKVSVEQPVKKTEKPKKKYEDYDKKVNDTLIVQGPDGKYHIEKWKGQDLDNYPHQYELNHDKLADMKWNSENNKWDKEIFKDISFDDVYDYLEKEFNFDKGGKKIVTKSKSKEAEWNAKVDDYMKSMVDNTKIKPLEPTKDAKTIFQANFYRAVKDAENGFDYDSLGNLYGYDKENEYIKSARTAGGIQELINKQMETSKMDFKLGIIDNAKFNNEILALKRIQRTLNDRYGK